MKTVFPYPTTRWRTRWCSGSWWSHMGHRHRHSHRLGIIVVRLLVAYKPNTQSLTCPTHKDTDQDLSYHKHLGK